ncbi:MAG: hypothetical protein H6Q11_1043 [Acidobacteria bacterium]|nr:hypothetical protein [Acidobacteriota bacterium]
MRLTVAMLADSAQVSGGKLYVLGGAFDTVNARAFPALVRTLSVVLVPEIAPAERNRDLPIAIRLLDEDGIALGVESKGMMRVGEPSSLPAGASSLVPLVASFLGIRFPRAGGYVFVVEQEGHELGRISFRVREAR